jgi:hypothetical protein
MRSAALLLAVLWIVSPALAIKPARGGISVEETLRNLNHELVTAPNYSNLQCSDRIEISLTPDRAEIVIQYRVIDKRGTVREELPPKFIYRIPVASVKTAYIWGPWTVHDRVIIRTSRRDVVKIGPLWDCWHNRRKQLPLERVFDNADLRVWDADDARLYRIADTFKHLVDLLQAESASVQPDSRQSAQDTPAPHESSPHH